MDTLFGAGVRIRVSGLGRGRGGAFGGRGLVGGRDLGGGGGKLRSRVVGRIRPGV